MLHFNGEIRYRIIGILCLSFLLIFLLPGISKGQENTNKPQEKKAIILIVDAVSWDDIINNKELNNFRKLMDQSVIGLMNVKTRGMNKVNAESGYLTIGVGMRSNAPDGTGKDVASQADGKIKVKGIELIKSKLKKELPNYMAGQLGYTAENLGLKVALIGNADTIVKHRESALMAMNNKGMIPYGNVGKDLLVKNDDFPGGYRTDGEVLFKEFQKYLPQADILFIDFGDTARIDYEYESIIKVFEQRADALKRADDFLGQVLDSVRMKETLIAVVVPNASKSSISDGNTSLTPIIIRKPGFESGLLTSNTTRREGLISNIDFAPTVFDYFTGNKQGFLGHPVDQINTDGHISKIKEIEAGFFNLRWGRFIAHGLFVIMLVLSLAFTYLPSAARLFKVTESFKYKLSILTLVFPLITLVMGPLLPFRHFIFESIIMFLTALVVTLFLVYWIEKFEHLLLGVTFITSLTILFYLFFAPTWLFNSPFGFDDVFLGGRYYGINNDAMGLLLGSTMVGWFSFRQWSKMSKIAKNIFPLIYLVLVVVSLTPLHGANVGGTIAAMSLTLLYIIYIVSDKPITFKRVLLVIGVVFVLEISIAYMESILTDQKTHAGNAVRALMESGFTNKFFELLWSKLRLFGLMLLLPPYNLILTAQIYIFVKLFKMPKLALDHFREELPEIYGSMQIIFYGGIIAFIFNDTGIIATVLMYTYFLLPFGILNKNKI